MNGKVVLISGLMIIFIGSHGANASEVVEYVFSDDGSGFVLYDGLDPSNVPIPVCIDGKLVWPESYSPPNPPPVICGPTIPATVWFMLVMGVAAGGVITIMFFLKARSGKHAATDRGDPDKSPVRG